MVLLFIFADSSLAERTVYADQGGVAVFTEDGKAGLVNSDGDVLLPAEYDEIHPFVGRYAIIKREDKLGVVRRDGSIALRCEWNWIGKDNTFSVPEVYDDLDLAVAYNDWYYQYLIDLNDGSVLLEGQYLLWADENYIFRSSYGYYDYWGNFTPPFHTDIFDLDMNLCLSLDADVERDHSDHWFLISEEKRIEGLNLREYSIVDETGNCLINRIIAQKIGEDGELVYTRKADNPLAQCLEKMGYYQNNVKWILHNLLGIDLKKAEKFAALLMEDRKICGILKPDGENVEIAGVNIDLRDDAGLYQVNTGTDADQWGFIDGSGAWVISPRYAETHSFVDGSAVVSEDGQRYTMIDTKGEQVGFVEWEAQEYASRFWSDNCYDQTIVPVLMPDGFRLANRQGAYISADVFPAMRDFKYNNGSSIHDATLSTQNFDMLDADHAMVADSQKHLRIIRSDGKEELNIDAPDDWMAADALGVMEIRTKDGLWGTMVATGADAGKWCIVPCYTNSISETEHVQIVRYPDGTYVFMDLDGNVLGPAGGRWNYDE